MTAPFLIALPALAEGETYAGIAIEDDAPTHHTILLPGEFTGTYQAAAEWAASIGGELPTRKEQALLFANAAEQFQSAWYWSVQQRESDPDYVWCQDFDHGYQDYNHRNSKLRARAVRRLPI